MHVYKASEYIKGDCGIVVSKGDTGRYEPLHTHEFIEIVYILSGNARHTVNENTYLVSEGDLIFMNYGCTHEFQSDEGFTYVNILFLPENVSSDLATSDSILSLLLLTAFEDMRGDSSYGKLSFRKDEKKTVESIVLAMLSEYRKKEISWQKVLGNYLSTMLIIMMRKNEHGVGRDDLTDAWYDLARYIEENLSSDLSLSALAKKCFYNPSYFSRIFKERFGLSPSQYITGKRLERVSELLLSTDMTVDKIAEDVGFADRKSLYNAFSKHFSTTPAKYRQEKQSKKTV